MSKAYEALQNLVGKDMGDFGGWDGLLEYCMKWYGDDMEVLSLIYQMESEAKQTLQRLMLKTGNDPKDGVHGNLPDHLTNQKKWNK